MYICIHIYTCVCVYIYICVFLYDYIYMSTYINIYIIHLNEPDIRMYVRIDR